MKFTLYFNINSSLAHSTYCYVYFMEVHLFPSSAPPPEVAFEISIFELKLFCLSIAHQIRLGHQWSQLRSPKFWNCLGRGLPQSWKRSDTY